MFLSGSGSRITLVWMGYERRSGWKRQKGTGGSSRDRSRMERLKTKARDTVAVNNIGTEPNDPLAYAPGSEHHRPTMSNLGGHGGQLERERYRIALFKQYLANHSTCSTFVTVGRSIIYLGSLVTTRLTIDRVFLSNSLTGFTYKTTF